MDQTSLTIYRAQPLVNCAQLLVLLVQRSNGADAFRELRQRYGMVIQQHLPDGVKVEWCQS